jgi:hypothetical protein
MASRWSEPSASEGDERFRVWPEGTDQYNHAELAANWDKLDAIIGVPAGGQWPSTTGVGGGLYREVRLAADAAMPLGAVFAWYRPHASVALPTGAVVCDGSVVDELDHDLPVSGDFTLPDLRNRFILGADYSKEIGTPAAAADSLGADLPDGAPGPLAEGGANALALTKDEMPTHGHSGSVTGWSPVVMQWYFQQSTYAAQKNAQPYLDNRDEAIAKCGYPGCYYDPERTAPIYPASENFEATNWGNGVHHSTGQGGWKTGQHRHNISALSSEGSGAVHENRPRYVGLIWLAKVRNG